MNNKLLSGALAALTLIGGTAAFGAAANAAPSDFGRHGGYVQDQRYDRGEVRRDFRGDWAEFRYRRDLRDYRQFQRARHHHRHDLRQFRSERYGRW